MATTADAVPVSTDHVTAAETLPNAHVPTATAEPHSAVELTDYPPSSLHGEQNPAPFSSGITSQTTVAEPLADTYNASLPSQITRHDTEAIGPATESNAQPTAGSSALQITLLLPSGARHPFKIDERYLKKRNIEVEEMSPLNISVYTMKELIWKDWRAEWEPRPASPAYIRLIFFGAMLDDKNALKDCRFNVAAPNVVHMSVKPQEITEDEDVKHAAKKGARRRSDADGSGSRCCVIL